MERVRAYYVLRCGSNTHALLFYPCTFDNTKRYKPNTHVCSILKKSQAQCRYKKSFVYFSLCVRSLLENINDKYSFSHCAFFVFVSHFEIKKTISSKCEG